MCVIFFRTEVCDSVWPAGTDLSGLAEVSIVCPVRYQVSLTSDLSDDSDVNNLFTMQYKQQLYSCKMQILQTNLITIN